MKKFLFVASFLSVFSLSSFSQTVSDVLRYSVLNPGGTARFMGAGGAFTALGAEFGAVTQNPAGLAMFRRSEVMFSPSMRFTNIGAALPNESAYDETGSRFGFDNFGIVFHTTPMSRTHNKRNASDNDQVRGWSTFNVGIGMNRRASFGQAVFYEGTARGSIMNSFYDDAVATLNAGGTLDDLSPFTSGLAWDAEALYKDKDGLLSYDFIETPNAPVKRSHAVNTFGRMNEMELSIAGNYEEKLMIGASLGVPMLSYRLEGEYRESDLTDSVSFFDKLTYTELLCTDGFGINAKFGIIYRATQNFRIGASVHTPTRLGLTDRYSNTFEYNYTDGKGPHSSGVLESLEGDVDYRLITPWRVNVGMAALAKNIGFISADVEVVDYGNNRYNLDANVPSADLARDERALNSAIQRAYKQAVNVRVGGEAFLQALRLRAGVNMIGKPQEGENGFNFAYSAGIGVRKESFFVDLGYRRTQRNSIVSAYANGPVAETNVVANDVVLTLGFKF